MQMKMPSEAVRGWVYRVLCAVGVVLVLEGVVTEQELQAYDLVATAVLGLASANTSVKRG